MGLEELRIIIIVYISAFLPLILLFALRAKIPSWVPKFYLITFLVCAFGWEIWFNYGLLNGDSVNERRSSVLNEWLPQNINWILNSMADAGAVSLGGLLLVKFLSKKDIDPFQSWRWVHFAVLFTWCIGQNLYVEMFLYHDQIANDKSLSWAPLSPFGQNFNPLLFQYHDRTVMLQTQIPWIILSPSIYLLAIKLSKNS